MSKQITKDLKALLNLRSGVRKVVKVAKITFGPNGKSVLIKKNGQLIYEKSGNEVVKHIDLDDPAEQLGAALVKNLAYEVHYAVGDGTTTAMILFDALVTEGIRLIASGVNPKSLENGIRIAHELAQKRLKELGKEWNPEKNKTDFLSNSLQLDQELMTQLIAVYQNYGHDTVIQFERNDCLEDELEVIDGIIFLGSYASPYFVNDVSLNQVLLENSLVLISEDKIENSESIIHILNHIADVRKPLVIIAKEIDSTVLSMLVTNLKSDAISCVVVKPMMMGSELSELLEDLAQIIGTDVCSKQRGSSTELMRIDRLGYVEKIIVTNNETTIIKGVANSKRDTETYTEQLKNSLKNLKSEKEKNQIYKRLIRLKRKMIRLKIGVGNEHEQTQKLRNAQKATLSIKMAMDEGLIHGAGVSWLNLISVLNEIQTSKVEEQQGVNLYKKMLVAPFLTLAENNCKNGHVLLANIMEASPDVTYDFKSDTTLNAWEHGLLDIVKVHRVVLEKVSGLALEVLKTRILIAENPKN